MKKAVGCAVMIESCCCDPPKTVPSLLEARRLVKITSTGIVSIAESVDELTMEEPPPPPLREKKETVFDEEETLFVNILLLFVFDAVCFFFLSLLL